MTSLAGWPPKADDETVSTLVDFCNDFALVNGLVYRPVEDGFRGQSAIHAPYALYPIPFPEKEFSKALRIQPLYNELYARVAANAGALNELASLLAGDDFQVRLFHVYTEALKSPSYQKKQLGLFRSDYMLDKDAGIRQVEFNTISVSFGPLCQKVSELHQAAQKAGLYPQDCKLPVNHARLCLAKGLAVGHESVSIPGSIIIFVVQHKERNAFDQRAIEMELLNTHGIRSLRLTLGQLSTRASLDADGTLLVKTASGSVPVSVVYYRAGYMPYDYHSESDWDTRLLIEKSSAIKCPSVALQLSGAKKVQQLLATKAYFERLAGPRSEALAPVKETFTGLYPLDASPEGQHALQLARSHPTRFVLKPQREGGGNNIYKEDIPAFLDSLDAQDAKDPLDQRRYESYILMDLIQPADVRSVIVKAATCDPIDGDVVSELGIFGYILFSADGDEPKILANEGTGHLFRTKLKESNEGGVAVGFSVLDSPLLV